jgi:glycosyltransferase involved in cell wall biosynthesis
MKILLVHAYFKPEFEQAEIVRTEREQRMVLMLRELGVQSEHCMLTVGRERSRASNTASSLLFPVDKVHGKRRRSYFSRDLCRFIDAWKPDLVLFKGMGFKLPWRLYLGTRHPFPCGFIVGGDRGDVLLRLASVILSESPFPGHERFDEAGPGCAIRFLPKLVPDGPVQGIQDVPEYDAVAVGNLIKRKNLPALRMIPNRFRVGVIGDGPLRQALEAEFADTPHIELLGERSPEDTLRLIARARVLVHPAHSEGVPRVAYEALSQGVPVIGLREVLAPAIRDGREGILVEDVAALGSAVEELLGNQELADRLKSNATEFAKTYLGEQALESVVIFLRDLVASLGPAAARKRKWLVRSIVLKQRARKLVTRKR